MLDALAGAHKYSPNVPVMLAHRRWSPALIIKLQRPRGSVFQPQIAKA